MSSPGMGTGSFGLRKELSSFMAIRSTMDTTLTTSVGRWVCGSWEQTSIRVWNWRKGNNVFPHFIFVGCVTLIHFLAIYLIKFKSIQLHIQLAIQSQVSPGVARAKNRETNNLNKQKSEGKASGSNGGTVLLMAGQVREEEKIGQEGRIERGVQTKVILFPGYNVNLT